MNKYVDGIFRAVLTDPTTSGIIKGGGPVSLWRVLGAAIVYFILEPALMAVAFALLVWSVSVVDGVR